MNNNYHNYMSKYLKLSNIQFSTKISMLFKYLRYDL